jgi:hypothetical protein
MRRVNLVKACSIIGFVLAEVYMAFVVLAPNRPGKTSRMLIPAFLIPKVEGVAPGTEPPVKTKITRLAVGAFFFGPFGAMAGLGVGLLLQGLRQSLSGSQPASESKPK